MPCLHEMCTAFFLFKASQPLLVTYLPTVVLETLILLSWSFFNLSVLLNYYPYTYSFFDNISHSVNEKMAIYSLEFPGLSSHIFTLDHLFTHHSDVFNSLAISLTKWPEYCENRCLSCSTNSVHLHFCEKAEKTKENSKNTKIENLHNGQEKYGGKKTRVCAHLGQKWKNIFSSNFSLKFLWTVIWKNFAPKSVYIGWKKH